MIQKLKLLWIDDEPTRKTTAINIAKHLGFEPNFFDVKGIDIKNKLNEIILAAKNTNLIIIDHILDRQTSEAIQTGSSIAEIIRENYPDKPIVGITAGDPFKDNGFHRKILYNDLFSEHDIDEKEICNTLLSITLGYLKLNKYKAKSPQHIIKLLSAPKGDEERLISIMPSEIKNNVPNSFSVVQWIRHVLAEKPGFMYDKLWISTLLGLKESSFVKIQHIFDKAIYSGIFSDRSNPRWWISMVKQILYKKIKSEGPLSTFELGRNLPKIAKNDYSECYVCKGAYDKPPEIVGYLDAESDNRMPMHLRCSQSHPKYEKALFFDEIRMMKGAE